MSQFNSIAAHQDGLYIPDEPTSLYNLGLLLDPPGNWEHLGHSFDEMQRTRFTSLKILQMLARAHLWGIRYHDGRPVTGQMIQTSLWKLFYYQRDECRPRNWSELFDWGRDTGPRLLRYNLDPRPNPVSRFYPDLPTIGLGIRSSNLLYQYPYDAPGDVSGETLEQFLFDLWREEAVLSLPMNMHREIDKSDGTWIYIKVPVQLPFPEYVSMGEVAKGITALGIVEGGDIETIQPHSPDGWITKLRSKELAWAMRSSRLEICGYATHTTLCKPESARIFFCHDYGWATIWTYLIQGLLQMKELRESGIRFWVGAHNPSYSGEHRALLIFESPVTFSDIEIPIPGPSPWLARFEGGRESDKRSMTKFLTDQCSVCFGSHPERPIQHCPQLNTLWTDIVDGSELLLPAPPSYFYFN